MKIQITRIIRAKNKFRKFRRARNKINDERQDKEDDNTISTNDGSDHKITKKIRISLNKSRRVITEK